MSLYQLTRSKYDSLLRYIGWSDVTDDEIKVVAASRVDRNVHENAKKLDLIMMCVNLMDDGCDVSETRVRNHFDRFITRYERYPLSTLELTIKAIYHVLNDYDTNQKLFRTSRRDHSEIPALTLLSNKLTTIKGHGILIKRIGDSLTHWMNIRDNADYNDLRYYKHPDRVYSLGQTYNEQLFSALLHVKLNIDHGAIGRVLVFETIQLDFEELRKDACSHPDPTHQLALKAEKEFIIKRMNTKAPMNAYDISVVAFCRVMSETESSDNDSEDEDDDSDDDEVKFSTFNKTTPTPPIVKPTSTVAAEEPSKGVKRRRQNDQDEKENMGDMLAKVTSSLPPPNHGYKYIDENGLVTIDGMAMLQLYLKSIKALGCKVRMTIIRVDGSHRVDKMDVMIKVEMETNPLTDEIVRELEHLFKGHIHVTAGLEWQLLEMR